MRKLIVFLTAILGAGYLHAGQDRFGSMRPETPRSSWTASLDPGVIIATNPTGGGQGFFLRSIYCSGVNPSTVTFFNAQNFGVALSTRDQVSYVPPASGVSAPFQIRFDAFYSSGIAYIKNQVAAVPVPCVIDWDYVADPGNVPYRP